MSGTAEPEPARRVAKQFFNETIKTAVASKGVRDLQARVNRRAAWPIGPAVDGKPGDVDVNQIETATVQWSYPPAGPEVALGWQWDVNTAPEIAATASFDAAAHGRFLDLAAEWVAGEMDAFEQEGK